MGAEGRIDIKDRITIYVGTEERKELIRELIRYTGASSVSEAIFLGISELLNGARERKRRKGKRVLEKVRGIWADDREIERAFEAVEEGWRGWKVEGC